MVVAKVLLCRKRVGFHRHHIHIRLKSLSKWISKPISYKTIVTDPEMKKIANSFMKNDHCYYNYNHSLRIGL